jgi:hypothetical protein
MPDSAVGFGLDADLSKQAVELAKTALLFMPLSGRLGKAATVATVLVYGASELDSNQGATLENVTRGTMGAAKGLGTRYLIGKLGANQSLDAAARGVVMGMGARALDVGLGHDTYFDKDGNFSLASAGQRIYDTTLNKKAIGTDFLLFGLVHMPQGVSKAFGRSAAIDPLIANMKMGGGFGLAVGGLTELDRQQQSGQPIDATKIAMSAFTRGGLDAIAAAPGGLYARSLARSQSIARTFEPSLSPTPGVKQFVVTSGDLRTVIGTERGASLLQVQELHPSTGKPFGANQSLVLGHLDSNTKLPASLLASEARIASCNPQLLPDAIRARHLFPQSTGDVFLGVQPGNRISLATSMSLLPADAPVKVTLGGPKWRTVSEMLNDPVVFNDILSQSARTNGVFQPDRLRRWSREISGQTDLVPECAMYDGKPYGYFVGGEQITIPLEPLTSGSSVGPVLKLSTLDFRKSWGFREFPMGVKDAKVLDGPYRMTMPNGEYNHWYLQERADSLSYHHSELVEVFGQRVKADGRYLFWDYKVGQFGFRLDKHGGIATDRHGDPRLLLLDYNAVIRENGTILEPNQPRPEKRKS